MAALEQDVLPPALSARDDGLDDATRRGLAIYETRLKAALEPSCNGQVVAIHLNTGDHVVARTSGDALRGLRRRRPVGPLLLHTIGPVSDDMAFHILRQRALPRSR